MAREAEVALKAVTDLAEARAAFEKFVRDVEAREIKLNVRTSGELGGSPATLGNPTGTGPTGAMAADRLDALSVARSSGPSLAMQNGRPGAASGGIAAAAGDILQQRALRESGSSGGEFPSEGAARIMLAMERRHRPLPDDLPVRRYTDSDAPVTALDRLHARMSDAHAAAFARRGTDDEAAYNRQADLLEGQYAIARGEASPIGGGPRGDRPESIRRQLSRYAATGFGIYAAGQVIQSINQFADIGQNPTGSTASLAIRNELASYQAFNGIAQGVPVAGPLLGGAMDFGSAIGNFGEGRGFVTEGTRLQRRAALAEARSSIVRQNLSLPDDIRAARTYDTREKIGITEDTANRAAKFDLDQDATLTPTDRANAFLMAKRRNGLTAETARRDFDFGISADVASVEAEGRVAADTYRRSPFDALADRYRGQLASIPGNTDPRQRAIAEQRFGQQYAFETATLRRSTRESTSDTVSLANASLTALSGNTLAADQQRIATAYEAAKRTAPTNEAVIGLLRQRQADDTAAMVADQRRGISAATSGAVARYQLADNPLGAQLAGLAGGFAEATAGMRPNQPEYVRAAGVFASQAAVARQGFSNQTKLIDIGQTYSGRALDRLLARDPVGAEAASIAGDTITQGNQLAFGGRSAEAEEARRQGLKRLDLEAQNYSLAFRGTSLDLQNIAINNQRDSQDPSEVFAQIEGRKNDVANATFGSTGQGQEMAEALKSAIVSVLGQKTLDDVITAITGLASDG